MRSMAMPRRSHHTDSLDRLNSALGLAKGTPLSERMAVGTPRSGRGDWKAGMAVAWRMESSAWALGGDGAVLANGIERFAHEQVARGVIGDGQRITVFAVAEIELAFEVGAPKIVRRDAWRQWRAGGARPRSTDAFDQAVPMQNGVDG